MNNQKNSQNDPEKSPFQSTEKNLQISKPKASSSLKFGQLENEGNTYKKHQKVGSQLSQSVNRTQSVISKKSKKKLEDQSRKQQSQKLLSKLDQRIEQKQLQSFIKRSFFNKMKAWAKQKEEVLHKREIIQQQRNKLRQEKQEKQRQQMKQQEEFQRLQKKKQLEKKIMEIEERRKKREELLKSPIKIQKPKFKELPLDKKKEQQVIINLKLLRDKKSKSAIDPAILKAHEQAYIQRLKERLNMHPPKEHKQPQSEFNLYNKKSPDEIRKEREKIQRLKKFQEKLSRMAVRIDEEKKKQILIRQDKAKNPRKYHILSQKSLNEQQIYNQFQGLDIQMDPKKKGNQYLKEVKGKAKQSGKKLIKSVEEPKKSPQKSVQINQKKGSLPVLQSKSQPKLLNKVFSNPEKKTEKNVVKEPSFPSVAASLEMKSEGMRPPKSRSFSQISGTNSYKSSLKKNKERDSQYITALKQKLNFLD